MFQPDGLEGNDPNLEFKLSKSLYGLKQAPKSWNIFLNDYLLKMGFQKSRKDPCMYFKDCTYTGCPTTKDID